MDSSTLLHEQLSPIILLGGKISQVNLYSLYIYHSMFEEKETQRTMQGKVFVLCAQYNLNHNTSES